MPPFQQHFSYIVGVSFIGGGNRRKPPTCLSIFSSPDPNVSYCHHVVRRKLLKKSSPLKVLNQWKPESSLGCLGKPEKTTNLPQITDNLYIVVASFIGGGFRSTWRKPLTCCKSLTNFIT
jgi:hypothetical protein